MCTECCVWCKKAKLMKMVKSMKAAQLHKFVVDACQKHPRLVATLEEASASLRHLTVRYVDQKSASAIGSVYGKGHRKQLDILEKLGDEVKQFFTAERYMEYFERMLVLFENLASDEEGGRWIAGMCYGDDILDEFDRLMIAAGEKDSKIKDRADFEERLRAIVLSDTFCDYDRTLCAMGIFDKDYEGMTYGCL